jgi:type I restriction enzyme S subunit
LPCLLVQRVARLRGGVGLENRFLFHLVSSDAFTRHILGVQGGSGVPHISGTQIKSFSFFKPAVREQVRLTDRLDELSTESKRLESINQQKLAALEELRKSLLNQAFSGEL